VACSSEGDILPKKERFSRPDAAIAEDGGGERDPNANCVKPGTPSNDRGVGGYCEPGRGDCDGPFASRFCTADYRDLIRVDDDKWFCSAICTMDEECGSGALCAPAPGGGASGCAPFACFGDGGAPQEAGR
jgi:hypothetical protein